MNCHTIRSTVTTVSMNTLYWHGLVSYRVYVKYVSNGCLENGGNSAICQDLYQEAMKQIGVIYQQIAPQPFPSLDPDNLYQDFCTGNGTLRASENLPGKCNPVGDQLTNYLNRADVQKAIGVTHPRVWMSCNNFNYDMSNASMVPYYESIFTMKPSIHILIYSGDVDVNTVPFTYTQTCIYEFPGTQKSEWTPWFVNGATAGYTESFTTYTYATLRGAGHEAPQYQPLNAYHMFSRYVLTQNLTAPEDPKWDTELMVPDSSRLNQGMILRSAPQFSG